MWRRAGAASAAAAAAKPSFYSGPFPTAVQSAQTSAMSTLAHVHTPLRPGVPLWATRPLPLPADVAGLQRRAATPPPKSGGRESNDQV